MNVADKTTVSFLAFLSMWSDRISMCAQIVLVIRADFDIRAWYTYQKMYKISPYKDYLSGKKNHDCRLVLGLKRPE